MERTEVLAIKEQDCKMVAIAAELELRMVELAVKVLLSIEEVKLEFDNMVNFEEKIVVEQLEHYIMAVTLNIEELELAVKVELSIKDIEVRQETTMARKAVKNIRASAMADKEITRVVKFADCTVAISKSFVAHLAVV